MIGKWQPINLKWVRKDQIFARLDRLDRGREMADVYGHSEELDQEIITLRAELADIEASETEEERSAYYAR